MLCTPCITQLSPYKHLHNPVRPDLCANCAHCAFLLQRHLLIVGDASGAVSLIDVTNRQLLWYEEPCAAPVVSLAVANCPVPPERQRAAEVQLQLEGQEAVAQEAAVERDASTGVWNGISFIRGVGK